MKMLLAVAAGGAVGAGARYLLVGPLAHLAGPHGLAGIPVGILAVNTLGSLTMGALVEATALAWSPPPELRAFLVVGVLGAFTTFSSFALEAVVLLERQAPWQSGAYVAASVVLSIAGLLAGMGAIRWLLT